MKDYIIISLKDAGIITSILVLFFYLLKRWFTKYIDSKFSENAELRKAILEIDKERLKKMEEKKDFIYPEILELVYRLKNEFKDIIDEADKSLKEESDYFRCGELGQRLYFLTENLYKYRAFIDEETFDNLHKFKRILQDATVILNSITRPDFVESSQDYKEGVKKQKQKYIDSSPELKSMLSEITLLYENITNQIKSQLEIRIKK